MFFRNVSFLSKIKLPYLTYRIEKETIQYQLNHILELNKDLIPFQKSKTKFFFKSQTSLVVINKKFIIGTNKHKNCLCFENLSDPIFNKTLKTLHNKSSINDLFTDNQKQYLFIGYLDGELEKYKLERTAFSVELTYNSTISTLLKSNCIFLYSEKFIFCANKTAIHQIQHDNNKFITKFKVDGFKDITFLNLWKNNMYKRFYIICGGKKRNKQNEMIYKIDVTHYLSYENQKKQLVEKKQNADFHFGENDLDNPQILNQNKEDIKSLEQKSKKSLLKVPKSTYTTKTIKNTKLVKDSIIKKASEQIKKNIQKLKQKNKNSLNTKSKKEEKQTKIEVALQNTLIVNEKTEIKNFNQLEKLQIKHTKLKKKSKQIIEEFKLKIKELEKIKVNFKKKNDQLKWKVMFLNTEIENERKKNIIISKKYEDLNNQFQKLSSFQKKNQCLNFTKNEKNIVFDKEYLIDSMQIKNKEKKQIEKYLFSVCNPFTKTDLMISNDFFDEELSISEEFNKKQKKKLKKMNINKKVDKNLVFLNSFTLKINKKEKLKENNKHEQILNPNQNKLQNYQELLKFAFKIAEEKRILQEKVKFMNQHFTKNQGIPKDQNITFGEEKKDFESFFTFQSFSSTTIEKKYNQSFKIQNN